MNVGIIAVSFERMLRNIVKHTPLKFSVNEKILTSNSHHSYQDLLPLLLQQQ